MTSVTLEAAALLAEARRSPVGRAARTVVGGAGKVLRQTLIALAEGHELGEHENPGEATVQVLVGTVDLFTATDSARASLGQLLVVPDSRHGLRAVEDSVVLLTVAVRGLPERSSGSQSG